jgi:hypothetical protein
MHYLHGKPTTDPAWRLISKNLLVNAGEWALDHDDGSRFMVDDSNVLIYGGAKQCYHGYNLNVSHNLFIRPDLGCGKTFCMENDATGTTSPKPQRTFHVANTCILGAHSNISGDAAYGPYDSGGFGSSKSDPTCHYDPGSSSTTQPIANVLMTPNGSFSPGALPCGAADFAEWQSLGFDKGGSISATPAAAEVMAMAKALLGC